MAVLLISSFLLADFISGIGHWIEDAYGSPDVPFLGKYVFGPNIIHHKDPRAMLAGNFFYRNWTTWLAVILLMGPGLFIFPPLFWGLTMFFVSMANEVHSWAHQSSSERHFLAQLLQDMAIVQTPKTHNSHHIAPYASHFCVISNILNPILEVFKFWVILECALSKIGIKTQRGLPSREGF